MQRWKYVDHWAGTIYDIIIFLYNLIRSSNRNFVEKFFFTSIIIFIFVYLKKSIHSRTMIFIYNTSIFFFFSLQYELLHGTFRQKEDILHVTCSFYCFCLLVSFWVQMPCILNFEYNKSSNKFIIHLKCTTPYDSITDTIILSWYSIWNVF